MTDEALIHRREKMTILKSHLPKFLINDALSLNSKGTQKDFELFLLRGL